MMNKVERSFALIDPVGSRAGLDIYDSALCSGLMHEGVNSFLISDFDWKEFPHNSLKVFNRNENVSFIRQLFLPFRYLQAIRKAVRSGCTSIVLHLFHFNRLDEFVLKQIRKRKLRSVIIVHDVGSFVYSTDYSRLRNICEHLADALVLHSKISADELRKHISEKAFDKVRVIPHGNYIPRKENPISKTLARKKLGLDPDKIYVLFFGMIKPNKGLHHLLKAWKNVSGNISLIIAGRTRSHSFKEYEDVIDGELKTKDIVCLIRHISNEDRDLLFQASDMIILPYTKIYQSGVMIYAMSNGLPVIASRLPSFAETITPDVNGLLVETENPVDLSSAINRLAADEELRFRIAANAKETMLTKHDWKAITGEFKKILF